MAVLPGFVSDAFLSTGGRNPDREAGNHRYRYYDSEIPGC
jgi:hypothetical protein